MTPFDDAPRPVPAHPPPRVTRQLDPNDSTHGIVQRLAEAEERLARLEQRLAQLQQRGTNDRSTPDRELSDP